VEDSELFECQGRESPNYEQSPWGILDQVKETRSAYDDYTCWKQDSATDSCSSNRQLPPRGGESCSAEYSPFAYGHGRFCRPDRVASTRVYPSSEPVLVLLKDDPRGSMDHG
jgi:hypothetical protein